MSTSNKNVPQTDKTPKDVKKEDGGAKGVASKDLKQHSATAAVKGAVSHPPQAQVVDTSILETSGILDSYEYFLRQVCKNGLPSGNVFEFAAQQILKFERKRALDIKKKVALAHSLEALETEQSKTVTTGVTDRVKQNGITSTDKGKGLITQQDVSKTGAEKSAGNNVIVNVAAAAVGAKKDKKESVILIPQKDIGQKDNKKSKNNNDSSIDLDSPVAKGDNKKKDEKDKKKPSSQMKNDDDDSFDIDSPVDKKRDAKKK